MKLAISLEQLWLSLCCRLRLPDSSYYINGPDTLPSP